MNKVIQNGLGHFIYSRRWRGWVGIGKHHLKNTNKLPYFFNNKKTVSYAYLMDKPPLPMLESDKVHV